MSLDHEVDLLMEVRLLGVILDDVLTRLLGRVAFIPNASIPNRRLIGRQTSDPGPAIASRSETCALSNAGRSTR
jgi:hypothetical protein